MHKPPLVDPFFRMFFAEPASFPLLSVPFPSSLLLFSAADFLVELLLSLSVTVAAPISQLESYFHFPLPALFEPVLPLGALQGDDDAPENVLGR